MNDGLSAGNQDFGKFVAMGKGVSTGKASFHVDQVLSPCEAVDKWVGRSWHTQGWRLHQQMPKRWTVQDWRHSGSQGHPS